MNLNSPMFHDAKCIADFGGRFAFGVSLGRDFAVVLHVMSQLTDMKRHAFFHWTKYPKLLPYQARYLNLLEKMYGFKAEIQIWPESKKAKQQDVIREFMERNGCSLCIQGFRMDESLQRRGMLKKLTDGIDYVRHYGYPLRSWTSKTVRGYCTANKVPLSIEYSLGYKHDFQDHRGQKAYVLRHQISEEDYQCAIAQDPNVEIDYVRYANDPNFLYGKLGKDGSLFAGR